MKKILLFIMTLCTLTGLANADLSWSTPYAISTPATNASDPHVAIDSMGNIVAIWVENNVIISSSMPAGGSWSTPVSLSNGSNTSSNPRIGIDGSGNVTALWIENTQIESATLPSGGSWSIETSPISGTGASNPSFAVDSSGNVVAVWVRSGYVESSTRISGTWNLVSVLSTANSSNPHVAISSYGIAVAVWHSVVSGADNIVSNILTISSNSWGTNKNVIALAPGISHNYPQVGVDQYGNSVVAWYKYSQNGNSYQSVTVLTASLAVGATAWTPIPQALSNPGIRNPADLGIKLKIDASGDAIAVWLNSYDGQTFNIESSQRLFGSSWLNNISDNGPTLYTLAFDIATVSGSVLMTNMAFDGSSNIFIQSQETDTMDPVIQYWTPNNIFSTGASNGYPKCAISLNGSTYNAVAVWLYFDGTNTVINCATASEMAAVPPTGLTITQSVTDYGVYQDYYNTLSWTPSTDPSGVTQYNIFRNGVYFTETNYDVLQFVDHNQSAGGTVTYGVSALNNNLRESPIATVTLNP